MVVLLECWKLRIHALKARNLAVTAAVLMLGAPVLRIPAMGGDSGDECIEEAAWNGVEGSGSGGEIDVLGGVSVGGSRGGASGGNQGG
jgi:hypothetical protein